jgi:hypothetical protein
MAGKPNPDQARPSVAHKRLEVVIGAWHAEATSNGDGQDVADPCVAGVP